MTYAEALEAIAALAPRGWRLGLDRMRALARRACLEVDGRKPKFIHVAGTNGKGSVTATIQSILQGQGHRTGAFFSPFVYDPRERIQFNGELISEIDFARLARKFLEIAAEFDQTEFEGVTEFEVKTAMGFAYWAEMDCDWVALEVGLGGRFDATNIIQPAASVITSIGWDHMAILGDTLEKIAFEKAGIIKPGVPVVVGEMVSGPLRVIESIAEERGSMIWRLGQEVTLEDDLVNTPLGPIETGLSALIGVHQEQNKALAVAACKLAGAINSPAGIRPSIEQTKIPGRFEKRRIPGKLIILDGAHNQASAEALASTLRYEFPNQKVTLVSGMVAGHNSTEFYAPLKNCADTAYIVPINFHRSRRPEELILEAGLHKAQAHDTLEDGIRAALSEPGELLLVTGSFYLVGEVGRWLDANLRRE